MKPLYTIAFAFLVYCNASASDVRTLFAVSNTLLVADWILTHELVIHNDYHEKNLVLGRHPTEREVDVYFASALVINYLLYRYLPLESKRPFFTIVSIFETATVSINASHLISIGVRF